ncbi:MAG: hypothetical protein KUG75_05890, partial [Pseudomonadales bacterium]|nr:hypothetical protein [Pseudomonadales bacterium]
SVNIERSFKYGDEVGGHLLSGHISCCAELKKLVQAENLRELTFSVNPSYIPYLMPKGFIALDGASLTISKLDREKAEFSVSLIPETIARTTLGLERLSVSNKINLELDSSTLAVVDTVKEVLSNMDIPSRPV